MRWIPALFWFFAPIGQQQENDISQRQIGGTTLGRYIKLMQNKGGKSSAPARAVAFCFAKQGGKSSPHQGVRILLRKTRRQILCSPRGSDFASQNKEAKSSPHQGVRILLRKTRRIVKWQKVTR